MAMDINIGDVSGCLEIIGDCVEAENDLQESINQWAQEEWCKFDSWYLSENLSFKIKYKLDKGESKIYDARGVMPESFVDKYRKNCAPHSMFWHMNKDEQFLWHDCNPNTKYALIRGCKGKKLYKVKCNICKRIFFMDSESFKCVKWRSCVGAKCLACVVNEEGIDYSKSLYAWDTEKNEIVETSTQLAMAEELSTPLAYYSVGTPNNILKIAYISDIHLYHHLKYYNYDARIMVKKIAKILYQSRSAADIILFNGDISSRIDLSIMFFKQFIREYDYEAFRRFKQEMNCLKEIKERMGSTVSKCTRCLDNVGKYIEKRKEGLRSVFDFNIFEKYKKKYHPSIGYEAAYEYFIKTKSFKKLELSEYTEGQILDIVRMNDVQERYSQNIAYYENKQRSEQDRVESFEERYSKPVEVMSLSDYRHLKFGNDVRGNIYLVLGNHEYIDFPDISKCVASYKEALSNLGITVLQNEYVETEKYILYGGTGFAKYDNVWNANSVICCSNFTREEEIEETTMFENNYSEALAYAKEKGLCFLCASHYPVLACLGTYDKEAIYFTGHNHQNEYVKTENKVLYADNQVGYESNNITFKVATTGFELNPYGQLNDGLYQTTVEDYLKFYRYIGEYIGEGNLLYMRCQTGKLYVVKRKGYYGFFIISTKKDSKGISIVNGGKTKKLTGSTDIAWICENFDIVVKKYLQMLLPLRKAQEELAKELKELGLDGTIHGLIVDIDRYHHIAINPIEGSMEFYYSSIWGMVMKLHSFNEVIKSIECHETWRAKHDYKLIQSKYQENSKRNGYMLSIPSNSYLLEEESYEVEDISQRVEQIVSRTSGMYGVSRKISPLQRLFSGRVLRDFDLRLTETKQQSYRKHLYTNRIFMYEGIVYQVVEDDGSDMIIVDELQKGSRANDDAIKLTGNRRRFSVTELKGKIKTQNDYDTFWIS